MAFFRRANPDRISGGTIVVLDMMKEAKRAMAISDSGSQFQLLVIIPLQLSIW
jgi:hypothetical protein